MKYVMAFGTADRGSPQTVEDGSTRQAVAEECRDAALSFMAGVVRGWDKRDLALWLTGDYARATRHRKHGERVAAALSGDIAISEESIADLVAHVHGQVLASLGRAAQGLGSLEFVEEISRRGLVRQATDAEGRDAWIPVDGARMSLRDRVQSLFVADYLNAPYAYAELFVCQRCEAVVFDAHAKLLGTCGAHRTSATVPREGDTPDESASNVG